MLGGQVVNALVLRSQGPVFESPWRQNSAHDCMALNCIEPFIITHRLDIT